MADRPNAHPRPHLRLSLQHQQGALNLDVHATLAAPWTVLFGPSGSGKSTILRILAGHLRPDHTHIEVGPDLHTLVDTRRHLCPPPHLRPIRSAGQTPHLFPHLSVRENLLYGVPHRTPPQDPEALLPEILDLFQLTPSLGKRPANLSGGEKQRVSVARTLLSAITTPTLLLLLDEPFAGLDLHLRNHLLTHLPTLARRFSIPVLSVTHDVSEPFLLDAEVLRLTDGRITAQGPGAQVLAHDRARLLQSLTANTQTTPNPL